VKKPILSIERVELELIASMIKYIYFFLILVMTKIYLNINIQSNRFKRELKLSINKGILKKKNIELVNDFTKSDLIIFLVNSRDNLINLKEKYNFLFKTTKPIILLERLDSSITWCRNLDKIKNLKAIIKNRVIRPSVLQNSQLYNGRYHSYLIYECIKNKKYNLIKNKRKDLSKKFYKGLNRLPVIPDNYLEKIHPILWDFHSSPVSSKMTPYRNKDIDFNSKNIDIFCIHSPHKEMIGWARQEIFNVLNKIKKKFRKKYKIKLNIVTGKLKPNEYIDKFRKSKICIACWGHGEWVHMDGYAMYSGVILIKPDTSHVQMRPDIYKPNETYIPCNPDFSNLEKIIKNTIDNYDKYKNMLIKNRDLVMSYNQEKCMNIFWDRILQIYNQ
jgi:hypothetical protein